MKKGIMLLLICMGLVLLVVLAIDHSIQAQGGGPRAEAMLMQSLPLENSWSYVSFELGVTDDQLPDIRKIYQESWNERKKLVEKAKKSAGDPEAMTQVKADAQKLKADLDSNLRNALTSKQLMKLDAWEKAFQKAAEKAREALEEARGRRRRP